MPELVIETSELDNGWTSMAVQGEVDLATADDLAAAIDEVFSEGSTNLVVDLNDTAFMDSTGVKTLVMAHRRFEEAGRGFALAAEGGPVSRLIDLSGIESSVRVVARAEDVATDAQGVS